MHRPATDFAPIFVLKEKHPLASQQHCMFVAEKKTHTAELAQHGEHGASGFREALLAFLPSSAEYELTV